MPCPSVRRSKMILDRPNHFGLVEFVLVLYIDIRVFLFQTFEEDSKRSNQVFLGVKTNGMYQNLLSIQGTIHILRKHLHTIKLNLNT